MAYHLMVNCRETQIKMAQKGQRATSTAADLLAGLCMSNRAGSQTFLKRQSDQSSSSCDSPDCPVHSIPAAAAAAQPTSLPLSYRPAAYTRTKHRLNPQSEKIHK